MGLMLGKVDVAEPEFDVVLSRGDCATPYEVRQYGERFAAETSYNGDSDRNSPFRVLASYIGVFGSPRNRAAKQISMTAPVVTGAATTTEDTSCGTKIAMTAPVVTAGSEDGPEGAKTMQFILPKEFTSRAMIPEPTDDRVKIVPVAASTGAVHCFNGAYDNKRSRCVCLALAAQLRDDGVDVSDAYALSVFQFWGFNPPFTIPYFRRNEVWIPLSPIQAQHLAATRK